MRCYFLILALITFGCNSNPQNTKQKEVESKSDKCFVYLSVVDSLQVRDLYDSARWFVYAWHCDILYKSRNDSLIQKSFGELELKFDNFLIKYDTLELNFNFMDKQQPILTSMTRDYKELVTGVGFNIKTKAKIYMISPNGFSTTAEGGANRYEKPLQPEVLAYIKRDWNKLDNCFKELIERKGISK